MYWYDFGRNDVYVGSGGRFKKSDCKAISAAEKEKIIKFFDEHLLKIYTSEYSSYDNSDDERVTDSYRSHSSYVYRELDVEHIGFNISTSFSFVDFFVNGSIGFCS